MTYVYIRREAKSYEIACRLNRRMKEALSGDANIHIRYIVALSRPLFAVVLKYSHESSISKRSPPATNQTPQFSLYSKKTSASWKRRIYFDYSGLTSHS